MPLLEIEQKFTFNPALVPTLLRKVHPHSHSRSLPPPLKTATFHDTYYDSQNKLSTAGLWLRKRRHLVGHSTTSYSTNKKPSSSPSNNIITTATDEEEEGGEENEEWEAKQSHQNSSYLRSAFSEIRDPQKISSLLHAHFPGSYPPLPRPRSNNTDININNKHNTRARTDFNHLFNLDTIASFTTTRTTLYIPFAEATDTNTNNHNHHEKTFTIALDSTDFGHRVGEVELMTDDADAAHADIDALVQQYPWFFNTTGSTPKGKLTAYFEKFGYPK